MIVTQRVHATTGRVWRVLSDLSHWAEIIPAVQKVKPLNDVPGVGARFEVTTAGLPKAVFTVTQWRPGRGFTWQTKSGSARTVASYSIESEGLSAARLVLSQEWEGPFGWAARLAWGRLVNRHLVSAGEAIARVAERRR